MILIILEYKSHIKRFQVGIHTLKGHFDVTQVQDKEGNLGDVYQATPRRLNQAIPLKWSSIKSLVSIRHLESKLIPDKLLASLRPCQKLSIYFLFRLLLPFLIIQVFSGASSAPAHYILCTRTAFRVNLNVFCLVLRH